MEDIYSKALKTKTVYYQILGFQNKYYVHNAKHVPGNLPSLDAGSFSFSQSGLISLTFGFLHSHFSASSLGVSLSSIQGFNHASCSILTFIWSLSLHWIPEYQGWSKRRGPQFSALGFPLSVGCVRPMLLDLRLCPCSVSLVSLSRTIFS